MINSNQYVISIRDTYSNIVEMEVLGIEEISTNIENIEFSRVLAEFQNKDASTISRPAGVKIDILIGYQYAAYHPVPIEAVGHLLLMKNRFGVLIAGSHKDIQERTKRIVKHATVLHMKA